jgi:hypothetical protein
VNPDWRGQWLSLHDLSRLMGKPYKTVYRLVSDGISGITILRCGGRVWVQLDPRTHAALADTLPPAP